MNLSLGCRWGVNVRDNVELTVGIKNVKPAEK